MTTEKAKQKKQVKKTEQPETETKGKNWGVIVSAIIGGIFVIAGVLITIYFTPRNITVILRDGETQKKIFGRIYVDNKPKAYNADPDDLQITVELRRGRHVIKAESNGYFPNGGAECLTPNLPSVVRRNSTLPMVSLGVITRHSLRMKENEGVYLLSNMLYRSLPAKVQFN